MLVLATAVNAVIQSNDNIATAVAICGIAAVTLARAEFSWQVTTRQKKTKKVVARKEPTSTTEILSILLDYGIRACITKQPSQVKLVTAKTRMLFCDKLALALRTLRACQTTVLYSSSPTYSTTISALEGSCANASTRTSAACQKC